MISKNNQLLLARCGDMIAQKMGQGQIMAWTNADYIKLSSAILKTTKVYVSTNTLKRIFGKVKTEQLYSPQKATLDALAVFVGHSDWDDFVTNNHNAYAMERSGPAQQEQIAHKSHRLFWMVAKSALLLVLVGIVIGGFWYWNQGPRELSYDKVRLVCINPEGKLQHAAIFRLELPDDFKDTTSFKLEFGNRFSLPMNRQRKQVLHSYGSPGWYRAILRHKNKAIDTAVICITTNGWYANSSLPVGPEKHAIEQFVQTPQGRLYTNSKSVARSGVDTTKFYFVNFKNIKKTNIDGDNFEMNAEVKASSQYWACAQINFDIYGQFSKDYIGVIKPECLAWTDANFSEQVKSGETNNLSSLGISLYKGGHIRLLVKDKFAQFFVNGKRVYAVRYQKPIGKVWGVKIMFGGLGEVTSFSLKDMHSGETF